MKSSKLFYTLGIILFVLGLAALACNAPIELVKFKYDDPVKIHTAVADFEATLESPEGEVVPLPVVPVTDKTRWVCKDIDGIVSLLGGEQPEGFILKKIDMKLTIGYDEVSGGEEKVITVLYYLEVERDEAWMGEGNQIVGWDHVKWTDNGTLFGIDLNENWTFGNTMNLTVNEEHTYPESRTYEKDKKTTFFGLISQTNFLKAYLCDVGSNPLPPGWENVTEEDFRGFCQHWYYECTGVIPSPDGD